MLQRYLVLLTAIFLVSYIFVTLSKPVSAQTACSNISNCTRDRSTTITYSGLSCTGTRTYYNCGDTECFQDSTTCSSVQGICNDGASGSTGDNYTCDNWCNDVSNVKSVESDGIYKTSNCKGCGHPGYPACPVASIYKDMINCN